jgi:hypothetical protein
MGLRHCNLSSNDLEIVFKRLSREKLDLQNNDKYDQKKDPLIAAQTMKCTKHTVASLGQGDKGRENGMFEDPLYTWLLRGRFQMDGQTNGRWPRGRP